jgi:hypothetical protein
LSETAHSLIGSAHDCRRGTRAGASTAEPTNRPHSETITENKSGHPLMLDGPSVQVIVDHLCRKGTSAETRTDAGWPRVDAPDDCLEFLIAWKERHDVLSGLVHQINCELARLYQ